MKVLTVDDSQVFLLGMRVALKGEGIEEVLEAHSAPEAMEILAAHGDIEVAIVDVSLEGESDGLDLVERLRTGYPGIRVLVLSHYKDPRLILKAISSGARAYIAKDSTPKVIVAAVKEVALGSCIFFGDTISPDTVRGLFGGEQNLLAGKPYSLTPKELSVLEMIASGYSNGEIAAAQGISSNTVESYKERIKTKLGRESIVACVAFAMAHQLIGYREK